MTFSVKVVHYFMRNKGIVDDQSTEHKALSGDDMRSGIHFFNQLEITLEIILYMTLRK